MNPKITLRDRKKEATSSALAEAAFELAMEKGLDGFIVDDVVQRAGYSRRTFANYFSCKEEAVATAVVTISNQEEFEHLFAELPEDATPLDVLYRLLRMQLTVEFLHKLRQFVSLSDRYPTLEPYILGVLRRLQISAQDTLAAFTHGRYSDGYPYMLAGAVYGVFMPLLDGSLNILLPGEQQTGATDAIPFESYLNSMFDYLRNGF